MRWLLRLLLSDADRRAIENDLAELFELRRHRDGERAATRWLRRQRLLYPLHLVVERVRGTLGSLWALLPHLWRDAGYSLRSLARTPALTATILLTVGVGLGATTSMIGVVRAVLVNPLPYASPEQLFWLYTDNPPYRFRFSVVDYRALEADHPAFSAVAAYQTTNVTVTDGGAAERVTAKVVTGSYFPLMGQSALAGRLLDVSDDARGDRVAVLTAAFWARRFASDPAGTRPHHDHRRCQLHRRRRTPERSRTARARRRPLHGRALAAAEAQGPVLYDGAGTPAARRPASRRTRHLARHECAALFPIWKSSYQDEKATWGLQDLKSRVVGDVGSTLVMVLAAVGCVLLIACANAINLLVARALDRSRELAIRSALGASRGRLLQYLTVESALLTAGAAVVGAGVAALAIQLVTAYGAGYIPRINEVRLSAPLAGWLAALAVGSGVLILVGGLVPAIHASRQMDRSLRSGGRSATDGPAARRLRRGLVAAQFALATPLIVAAALVATSLDRLSRVSVGIETSAGPHGRRVAVGAQLYTGERPQGLLGSLARSRHGLAGSPGGRARGQPATERGGAEQQLRSRRSSDPRRRESAHLHLGRRVPGLLSDRRIATGARPSS